MTEYPADMRRLHIHIDVNGREHETVKDVPPGWRAWSDPMRRDWARDRCLDALDDVATVTWSDADEEPRGEFGNYTSWDMDGDPIT